MKNKTKERIKIAALKEQVISMKKDYKKTVDGFNDLMERACKVPEDFPDGFLDAFVIGVIDSYSHVRKYE